MKLSRFLKGYEGEIQKREKLDGLINLFDFVSKSSGDTGRAPTMGIDTLVNSWVRQQFAYRSQLIEDLFTITRSVSEVSAPILHIRNEVFRRGLTWEPAFAVKCLKCGKEHESMVEKCDGEYIDEKSEKQHCDSTEFRDPDDLQLETMKDFLDDCNCLVPDTLIRIGNNQRYKRIDQIKSGDLVVTASGPHKVRKVFSRLVDEDIIRITLQNKVIVKVTREHPILTNSGWVKAENLTTKMILITPNTAQGRSNPGSLRKGTSLEESYGVDRAAEITRKNREKHLGILKGKYDYVSSRKGLSYEEYFGEEKATELKERLSLSHRGLIPWNVGLTTDNSSIWEQAVKKRTATRKRMYAEGTLTGYWKDKSLYEKTKRKISKSRVNREVAKGPRNPNWRGGISNLPYTFEFDEDLKKNILFRDIHCQLCGAIDGRDKYHRLSAHHIDYDKSNNHSWNLVALCHSCHAKTSYNREYWKGILISNLTKRNLYPILSNGIKIKKIEYEHYKGLVYNLEVEIDHTYCGQSVVFHNCFDQSFEDVLKQFYESISVADDGYLYLNKEYSESKEKDDEDRPVVRSKVVEIRHLRPSMVEFDLDEQGLPKNKHFLCVFHRDLPPSEDKEGKCSECGRELVPAMFKYKYRGNYIYLMDNEIVHISKFHPSETYGYSVILTLFEKALTLIGMDKTVFRYFFERKMPLSLLMVATDDTESIHRARSTIVSQVRENPDVIPIVGYSAKAGNRGRVDFVRLFNTLQEMDYLPIRQELRERVAGIFGLPPMWQSEYTGMGGLSSQSQQMVQFSRVVESDQRMFNEKVFPFVLENFGITDWKLVLKQPEEKAEATRIQFAQQRVSIASMLQQLGFKIELREGTDGIDNVDFKISGEKEEQEQPQMGGFGEEQPSEEEGGGSQFGFSQKGWTKQILDKGYSIDSVFDMKSLPNGQAALVFKSSDKSYVAAFQPLGQLIDVWSYDSFAPDKPVKPDKPDKKLSAKTPQEEVFKETDEED